MFVSQCSKVIRVAGAQIWKIAPGINCIMLTYCAGGYSNGKRQSQSDKTVFALRRSPLPTRDNVAVPRLTDRRASNAILKIARKNLPS